VKLFWTLRQNFYPSRSVGFLVQACSSPDKNCVKYGHILLVIMCVQFVGRKTLLALGDYLVWECMEFHSTCTGFL
jgi:hypothetical protein